MVKCYSLKLQVLSAESMLAVGAAGRPQALPEVHVW